MPSCSVEGIGDHIDAVLQGFRAYWQTDCYLEGSRQGASVREVVANNISALQRKIEKQGAHVAASFALTINTQSNINVDWVLWISPAIVPRTRLTLFDRSNPGELAHPPSELITQLVKAATFDFGRAQNGATWVGEACRFYVAHKLGVMRQVPKRLLPPSQESAATRLINTVHEVLCAAGDDALDGLSFSETAVRVKQIDRAVQRSCPRQALEQSLEQAGSSYNRFFSVSVIKHLRERLGSREQ